MANISIANLPAFIGASDRADLLVTVDVSDTTESTLGTTKRLTVQQLLTNATVFGSLTVTAGPIQLPFGAQLQWGDATNAITVDQTTDAMRFYTANQLRMIIDGLGGVIIGADPGGTDALRVGGIASVQNIRVRVFGGGSQLLTVGNNDSGGPGYRMVVVPN